MMNPNIKIRRTYEDKQTKGNLYVTDECGETIWKCKSLELVWNDNKTGVSCFPEGRYIGKIRNSKKYGRHIHITGIEDRSLCLIHWGNWAGSVNPKSGRPDVRGCVMVGSKYADFNGDGIDEISSSKNTFNKLMKYFPNNDDFIIEVERG